LIASRATNGEGKKSCLIDSEGRKRGERTGLETPVVHALNDGLSSSAIARIGLVKALKAPPE
jgi:hypothetical protein